MLSLIIITGLVLMIGVSISSEFTRKLISYTKNRYNVSIGQRLSFISLGLFLALVGLLLLIDTIRKMVVDY
jgi:riboflavin transporter FmnP